MLVLRMVLRLVLRLVLQLLLSLLRNIRTSSNIRRLHSHQTARDGGRNKPCNY
jgi:hypothetical protein